MKNLILQLKRNTLFVLLLTLAGIISANAQDFTVDNLKYTVIDNGKSVAIKGQNDGPRLEGNFEIPEEVTYNGVKYTVTKINDGAFVNNNKLVSITIPASVVSIKSNPFWGCEKLERINVMSGNESYDSRENCNAIINSSTNTLVVGCKSSIIPNSVVIIGEKAFLGCRGLTSITIPNSVISIEEHAFENTGLITISIPKSVVSLVANAFFYTEWYKRQPDGLLVLNGWCLGHKGEIKDELMIRNNTKYIASRAFEGRHDLKGRLNLPNSVTTIGEYAFCSCRGLNSVMMPNSVNSIGRDAFAFCEGLTSVTIPQSVTFIEDNPFVNCTALMCVIVDSGNTVYDSRENCNAIIEKSTNSLIVGCKNSFIPNSVTSIGDGAFCGCEGLTDITVPNSVTMIGVRAFLGCSKLTSITIPSSVKTIGERAFAYCNRLNSVIIESQNLRKLSFEGNLEECKNLRESDVFKGCENLHKSNIIYR